MSNVCILKENNRLSDWELFYYFCIIILQTWIYDNIPFNWLLNQDKYGFHLLIEIDWWLQINCKMSENLWEKKDWQLNYIENNSLICIITKKKVFQNQKENVHNISMAGFLVGSS